MRLRHIPAAREFVAQHPLALDEEQALACRGQWSRVFGRVAPLQLEIGMGRGRFLTALAQQRPEINFLGLELREEVLMQAIRRLEEIPPNLRFLQLDAALLTEVFAPGEIDRLYLNFPDPWPKARHAKRRLTAPAFVRRYHLILANGGQLLFKTDNQALFDWSLPNFEPAGLTVAEVSADLPLENTLVCTEYEARYRRLGQPIYFIRAVK